MEPGEMGEDLSRRGERRDPGGGGRKMNPWRWAKSIQGGVDEGWTQRWTKDGSRGGGRRMDCLPKIV